MTTIEDIKNECRAIIAQADKATPGPWSTSSRDDIGTEYGCPVRVKAGDYDVARNGTPGCFLKSEDAAFIASARSFTPRAAKALLVTIEALEQECAKFNFPDEDRPLCFQALEPSAALGRNRNEHTTRRTSTPNAGRSCRESALPEAAA